MRRARSVAEMSIAGGRAFSQPPTPGRVVVVAVVVVVDGIATECFEAVNMSIAGNRVYSQPPTPGSGGCSSCCCCC